MFDTNRLLEELKVTTSSVIVQKDENFDFNKKDEAFIIELGSVLAYGERDLTQTFTVGDPIGFAEVIAARQRALRFKKLTDLKLRKFDGVDLRKKANTANVVSRTIIKYSLGRIFDLKRRGGNILFEEKFLDRNFQLLRRSTYDEGGIIFRIGQAAHSMYFLEKGSVSLFTENSKKIAELVSGECFGEAALINDRRRNYIAIANQRTSLIIIEQGILREELEKDPPVVRLAVILLLKRLELMNKLKWADNFKN